VLLIIWDTVRAASLSLYGYGRETTPTLQRLAGQSIVYDRAFSTTSWTTPSHASIFTGLYPPDLSADWKTSLNRTPATLAETLSALGYRTAGFTANTYATGRESGLSRGFSRYQDFLVFSAGEFVRSTALVRSLVNRERWRHRLGIGHPLGHKNAAIVERQFLNWLGRDPERPFFAFLNLFDAHAPYLPPAPFDSRFGPKLPDRNPQMTTGRKFTARELQAEIDAYDGAIAELDDRLGTLLAELDRRGVLDNTLVIITSDHGEEFGEHHLFTHGNSLYDRSLHVPLLISMPRRLPEGRRVEPFVSLRDIPATVLDILDPETVPPMPGSSLLRFLASEAADDDGVGLDGTADTILATLTRAKGNPPDYPVSQGNLKAVIADPLKLIANDHGTVELYDLRADPAESRNLAQDPGKAADRMRLASVLERLIPQAPIR
jgi:arylsulfatase A-like enzyme